MKSSEFRIGNWLIAPGITLSGNDCYHQITELHNVTFYCDSGYEKYDYMEAEPIPITSEILNKAGFEQVADGVWRIIKESTIIGIALEIDGENPVLVGNDSCMHYLHPKITWVHQLQNIVFCLTGEELNIVLK
jgi:hypothetical protein